MSNERLKQLLIVEDDPGNWLPLKNWFLIKGWEVEQAEYAETAIELLRKNTYSAFIVDISLRGKDGQRNMDKEGGLKVVKEIMEKKKDFSNVIVYSGRIEKGESIWTKLQSWKFPETQILTKPEPVSKLYNLIKLEDK